MAISSSLIDSIKNEFISLLESYETASYSLIAEKSGDIDLDEKKLDLYIEDRKERFLNLLSELEKK